MAAQRTLPPKSTILVVEDEPFILMVVAETLRDAGYKVLETGNGEAALGVLAENPHIDLLMTDIKMPGISGYQLVQQGLELRPNLRILLMTGYAQERMPNQIAHLRIPILRKPFDFETLPELAKSLLSS